MQLSDIRITILMDDRPSHPEMVAEHGASFWIELPEGNLVFDTGLSENTLRNSERLQVNLSSAHAIVLSHGHYDHIGGLEAILRRIGTIPVYAHPEIFRDRYSRRSGKEHYIGVTGVEEYYRKLGAQFHWVTKPQQVLSQVWISGEIPRRTNFETVNPRFQYRTWQAGSQSWQPDLIPDDMALFIHTGQGVVVITGCGHSGIVNTVQYAREVTGTERIAAVIGGMHLVDADQTRRVRTTEALAEMEVGLLVPLHCTGEEMRELLCQKFENRVKLFGAGDQIIFKD